MIDLHMHTFFSDGELIPSELVQRACQAGYTAMAITDHADYSNMEGLLKNLSFFVKIIKQQTDITVIPGIELTHVPPTLIPSCIKDSRRLGAQVVVVHGETIVEPVMAGSNRAGIEAGADIIAHPGLIEEADVKLAAEQGVYLELTTRRGHSLTNGHVARLAKKFNARLIVNTDTHSPSDLLSHRLRDSIVRGAGLNENDIQQIVKNSEELVTKILVEYKED